MYKNQLQELAQRSCFNLPSYACIREGPDHAPRFKASVNFNGEIFEGPSYCTTLRQAEHAAAEVALNTLSTRGPSRSLTAKVLDETGVYKNLLQETAHRAGLNLPVYTTVRSGPGHLPVFTCTVELAGMNFTGQPAKTKKQAQKNAAMAAWSALKQLPNLGSLSQTKENEESAKSALANNEEQEQVNVARVLSNLKSKDERKPMRQRNHQSVARSMMMGYRESMSKPPYNASNYKKWRTSDLLSDASSVQPPQTSPFLTLPPAPKISQQIPVFNQSGSTSQDQSSSTENNPSLVASSKLAQVQVRRQAQAKKHDVPPPLEEHQNDEQEWLKTDVNKNADDNDQKGVNFLHKSAYVDSPSPANFNRARHFGPPPLPSMARPVPVLPPFPHSRILHTGGFYSHGIAPAVNIRSVIPVCAAPPMRRPSNPPPVQQKEASAPVSAGTEEEIKKLNLLQL
ncbi:double-stranded RNA-binding protein 3-like [Aristolochia californica]|uniref:double-stranded RNA-binding protein 3-like n=1 Tax=Aristolochia californica TaxID=171875 RepID=UPI0035DC2EF4